jgi:hypothetical protein
LSFNPPLGPSSAALDLILSFIMGMMFRGYQRSRKKTPLHPAEQCILVEQKETPRLYRGQSLYAQRERLQPP